MRVWEWEARFERSARENWKEWVVRGSEREEKKQEKRKRWTRGWTCREKRWVSYVRFRERKEKQRMEREDVRLWVSSSVLKARAQIGLNWARGSVLPEGRDDLGNVKFGLLEA